MVDGFVKKSIAAPFVIPCLTRNPEFFWFPAFAGTTSGYPLEFTPYLIRGRYDSLGDFLYDVVKN